MAITMLTGKGGVGKTTVAVSLAASFGGSGRLVQFGAASGPEFVGVERCVLRPDRCVENLLSDLVGSRKIARFALSRPSVKALLDLSDAVRVIAQLERVRQLHAEGHQLVLDLPATGHALSWIRSVRSFRELTRRGAAHDVLRRIEDEVLHPDVLQVWIVALPTDVAIAETIELETTLRATGLTTRVVMNRVTSADTEAMRFRPPGPAGGAFAPAQTLPVYEHIPFATVGRSLLDAA